MPLHECERQAANHVPHACWARSLLLLIFEIALLICDHIQESSGLLSSYFQTKKYIYIKTDRQSDIDRQTDTQGKERQTGYFLVFLRGEGSSGGLERKSGCWGQGLYYYQFIS